MINDVFSSEEIIAILTSALKDKSAVVRRRAANVAWEHRLKEMLPVLASAKQTETNATVLDAIKFARFYMDKPPGNSVTFTWEDSIAFENFE